jgi:gas vesicle protein
MDTAGVLDRSASTIPAELATVKSELETQIRDVLFRQSQLALDHEDFKCYFDGQLTEQSAVVALIQRDLNGNRLEERLGAHDRQLAEFASSLPGMTNDIATLRDSVNRDIARLKKSTSTEIPRQISELRTSVSNRLTRKISELQTAVMKEISQVNTRITTEVHEIRANTIALNERLNAREEKLEELISSSAVLRRDMATLRVAVSRTMTDIPNDIVIPYIPPRILTMDQFTVIQTLRTGPILECLLVEEKSTGRRVCMRKHSLLRREDCRSTFVQRAIAQGRVNLPGVIRLIGLGFDRDSDTGILVEDFLPNGSLDEMIKARFSGKLPPQFGPTAFSKSIFGIAATLYRIHSKQIVHYALKPTSIFIDENYEPQITDFCDVIFTCENSDWEPVGGLSLFTPPEFCCMHELPLTEKLDVFSYGVILYTIFTNARCFTRGKPCTAAQISRSYSEGDRLMYQREIPNRFWELIRQCWNHAPEQRPSFEEITHQMLDSDEFVLEGTNLDEYHEYQQRITSRSNASPIAGDSEILESLRSLGIDVDSIRKLAD